MSALREGNTGFGGLPINESSETSASPISEKIPEFGSPEHRAKISQQSIDEAVKLRENLKERVEYMSPLLPLSYEGAVLLCTLIALKKNKFQKLMCLPSEDVRTILHHTPKEYANNLTYNVEFDADNNFNMLFFISSKKSQPFTVQLKNLVVNREIDDGWVPIIDDKENGTVQIGPIKATKESLKSMCGIKGSPELPVKPQVANTVNKNAYEIRTDVLSMALDFVKYKWDGSPSGVTDVDVLETARKFYNFVENRRG